MALELIFRQGIYRLAPQDSIDILLEIKSIFELAYSIKQITSTSSDHRHQHRLFFEMEDKLIVSDINPWNIHPKLDFKGKECWVMAKDKNFALVNFVDEKYNIETNPLQRLFPLYNLSPKRPDGYEYTN